MGVLADLGMDEKEMANLAKKLLENKKWLDKNYDKIEEEYKNKFVAVDNYQIVDSDEDFDTLIKKLKKVNKSIDNILIELINPKNAQLILKLNEFRIII